VCPCSLPVLQRFAINPRAFVVQAASLAVVPLRTVFNAFNYLTDLTDEDNNNDVAAITAFANGACVSPWLAASSACPSSVRTPQRAALFSRLLSDAAALPPCNITTA
jgi:hypothetical protein